MCGNGSGSMFIGRQREYDVLSTFLESEEAGIACVTGARGMGKSALLRKFAQENGGLYFCAYETTGAQELVLLADAFAEGAVEKQSGSAASLEEELSLLLDRISERAKSGRVLLIVDQYPNFAKAEGCFDEIIYRYYKENWKDLPVKLIFCGDAFLLMEKFVSGKKARWKNDILCSLQLQGLTFDATREFFPQASAEDLALYYGISGGIPAHLVRMQGLTLREAAGAIFDPRPGSSALLPDDVMGMELRELSYYNCILSAMAQGMNRVNQLSAEVGKPKDVIVPYLNALMSIGVVTKQTAITEETNRKKTRYSIVNSSVIFWYRYIVPHYTQFLTSDWADFYERFIADDIDNFMQQVFIAMSREHIERSSREGLLPFQIERSGNWWTNDDEAGTTDGFDVVSLGKSGDKDATIFTLCFYGERQIEVPEVKAMIDKTKQLHRDGDAYYVVCAKDRFCENVETVAGTIKNIILVTLADECAC